MEIGRKLSSLLKIYFFTHKLIFPNLRKNWKMFLSFSYIYNYAGIFQLRGKKQHSKNLVLYYSSVHTHLFRLNEKFPTLLPHLVTSRQYSKVLSQWWHCQPSMTSSACWPLPDFLAEVNRALQALPWSHFGEDKLNNDCNVILWSC